MTSYFVKKFFRKILEARGRSFCFHSTTHICFEMGITRISKNMLLNPQSGLHLDDGGKKNVSLPACLLCLENIFCLVYKPKQPVYNMSHTSPISKPMTE